MAVSPLPSSLRRAGELLLGGSPSPFTSPESRGKRGGSSGFSTPAIAQYDSPSGPPSVRQTGRLYNSHSCPSLEPWCSPAENLPSIKGAKLSKAGHGPGLVPCLWSDSMRHLTQDSWPSHAVPLFVFCGKDRPRTKDRGIGFREHVQLTIKEERYVNFCIRLRCGGGDRYMGGSIGLIHTPDRREAEIGQEGQLVTILDMIVNPDSTVTIDVIGDQPFVVQKTWMPRSLRDLQFAIVQVEPIAVGSHDESLLATMLHDPSLYRFGRLVSLGAPALAAELQDSSCSSTVFVPTNAAIEAAFGDLSDEEIVQQFDVETMLLCHIVPGRFPSDSLYTGRALVSADHSALIVTFRYWPRGEPSVNGVPVVHVDVTCSNGVIHILTGMLRPTCMPGPCRGRGR